MGKIVLGLGTSHSPQLSIRPEEWEEVFGKADRSNPHLVDRSGRPTTYQELEATANPSLREQISLDVWQRRFQTCQEAIERLSQTVAHARPDVVLIVGDDQDELLHHDNLPAILVYWGDEIVLSRKHLTEDMPEPRRRSLWAYFPEQEERHPGHPALAQHIIRHMMERGVDAAQSNRLPNGLGLGHAFGFVYRRILKGLEVPVVPVMLNTYFPPNQPTPKRCLELGKVIREAVETMPEALNVAIVASGGLSHFLIDEELDHTVLAAMQARDYDALARLPRQKLEKGTSEVRNWLVVAAAVESLAMQWIVYEPCYRTPAGTGCAMAFAVWS